MPRLLFEKSGRAVWISHLDLMRLFQRAFKRANLPLTHTHGFNPRPSVSIALPLSVGTESLCELLDFDLEGEGVDPDEICRELNKALIPGVKVLRVYTDGRKVRDLALLRCQVYLKYNQEITGEHIKVIEDLFGRSSLLVEKKTKSGPQEQDIIPMIRKMDISFAEDTITLDCVICCQNPTLNPMQLVAAIERYLPQFAPDSSKCRRIEVYDHKENVFR